MKFTTGDEKLLGKIILTGTLTLAAPLIIGAGNGEGKNQNNSETDVDGLVLKDKNGHPFIPATSLAGVLKNLLSNQLNQEEIAALFGTEAQEKDGWQSSLSLYDIELTDGIISVRDGVSINALTGTAVKGHKFDFEVVDSGAHGEFTAIITKRQAHRALDFNRIINSLTDCLLAGFHLGARTTNGLGLATIKRLTLDEYDFADKKDIAAWLAPVRQPARKHLEKLHTDKAFAYSDADFAVELEFALNHSLIVRTYDTAEIEKREGISSHIDALSLRTGDSYLIPGSSLKGIIRHQAEAILRQTGKQTIAKEFINNIFGVAENNNKRQGHLFVEEITFDKSNINEVAQTRNRIDRFTGGTIDTALFTEKALWQKDTTRPLATLRLVLKKPADEQIGLLLFVLRDIWCGQVAIGGEKSIGRGFVTGLTLTIHDRGKKLTIQKDIPVDKAAIDALEQYTSAFNACKEVK